jgi:iron(III) transport system permease protein
VVHLEHRQLTPRQRSSHGAGRALAPQLRRLGRLAASGPYGLLIALLLIPTVCFLLLAFAPSLFGQGTGGVSLAPFRAAYQGYVVTALGNSLWVGLAASGIALAVAVGLAWLCERIRIPGTGAWRLGVWLLLLVPTYLSALGLEDLLAPQGVIASVTGWNPAALDNLLLGPVGVVLVLSLRGIAFAYFAVAGVIRSLGSDLAEAARVHGLSRRRTAMIQLTSLAPALLAGFVLVFAETVSDFGVASTLAADAHFPVITYVIFTFTAAIPIDFPAAAAVSWSLIAVFAVVLLVQRRITAGRDYSAGPAPARPERGLRGQRGLGRRGWAAAVGAAVFFVITLIGPALGIVASSVLGGNATSGYAVAPSSSSGFTVAAYRLLFDNPGMLSPIWLSLWLGLAGATVAVVVGLVVNLWTQFRGTIRATALIDVGLVAVIGLPSIVLAGGFVFFYDLPSVYQVVPVYGTQWLLLAGYVVGFAPIAIRMLQGPLAQAGRSGYDAGRVHGAIAVLAWTRAVLPLTWRSVVSVWLFLMGIIMFELPLSEILHAPSGEPLAVSVAVQYKSEVAIGTALTVIGIAVMLAVLGAVGGLLRLAGLLGRRLRARDEAAVESLIQETTTRGTS